MTLNLRQRIAAALFVLTTLGAGLLGLTLWAGHYWMESRTLDRILSRELALRIQENTHPSQVASEDGGLQLFRPRLAPTQLLPKELRGLQPGSYRDYRIGRGVYHVLVRDAGPGDRVWLAYDVDDLEQRELWLLLAILAGVTLTGLLAWGISRRLSQRLLQPLEKLIDDVRQMDWNQHTHRLDPARADDDLRVIVTALNRLFVEVDELVQRERAFASAASHELRTPLASIRAAAEVLEVGGDAAQLVPRITRAVDAASRDLEALLALSRHREAPEFTALPLDRCLAEFAQPYCEAAPQVRMTFALTPTVLHAPRALLEVVFTNLLRNALNAGNEVVVRNDAHSLVIRDNGTGIAADLLPHIFEPGITGREGGSGMGLYIARTLAERVGWQVSLHNRTDGTGAEAVIRFG